MAMSEQEWEQLADRYEDDARRDPDGYRRRVARFLALGYVAVGLSIAALVALVGAIVWFAIDRPVVVAKLAFPIVALAWIIARSLWIKLEKPDGIPVDRSAAPDLHRMVDEVNAVVKGPKIHEILVDADFNAAVVQNPRPGFIFGSRNYLLLGLPYVQSKTPDELRSTVAHELAHLSSNHGRTGAWLYRVEATWWKLLENLEQKRHLGTGIFRRFFEWYLPRLRARSFPLSRAHEREADELAVAAAGGDARASSLVRSALAAPWVADEYWPRVYERVLREAAPPSGAHRELGQRVATAYADDDARARFDAALAYEPGHDDTHPPLRERLEIAGVDPEDAFRLAAAPLDDATAAKAYLGPLENELVEQLDDVWRRAVADEWSERHRAAREAEARLVELERANGALDLDDVRVRARLSDDFRSPDEALARWREVLQHEPDDDEANLAVGTTLLARDDDSGLRHLDVAARSLDPQIGHAAFAAAISWLQSNGREDDAKPWLERLEHYVEVGMRSGEERAEIRLEDEFTQHALDAESVQAIRGILAREHGVKRAWLVRKRLEHFDDEAPLHVLAIEPTKKWRTFWNELDAEEEGKETVADRVATALEQLPHEVAVVTPGPRAGFEQQVAHLDALVYDRDGDRTEA